MCTGNCQHPFIIQYVLANPLRTGRIGQAAVQNFFHQRITARNNITHHKQVGLQRNLRWIVTFDQLDALRGKLRAHWRIDIGVATSDTVSGFFRQHGEPAHERTAYAENMNVHCRIQVLRGGMTE